MAENHWIDPVFAAVLQERGYIGDALAVTQAEVAGIEDLDVSGDPDNRGNIISLRGLEYFKSLRSLDCSLNQLRTIDLTGNPRLAELYCHYNLLAELDLSTNGMLTTLVCSQNVLSTLDLSRNPYLRELNCDRNKLVSLDVKSNAQLTGLVCDTNLLRKLDITANPDLVVMVCLDNPGENGIFEVKAPFDSSTVPSECFTTGSWVYSGSEVRIVYIKQP